MQFTQTPFQRPTTQSVGAICGFPRNRAAVLTRGAGAFVFLCWALFASFLAPTRAEAAFGLTNSGGYYTVDTGAGLVFKVKQTNGDITSLNYNGVEYQEPTKGSHINSGLGTSTVTGALWGSQTIKIEVESGTLTHYYMARKGQNHIFMGTYFTEEPSIGLVRFIVRIPSGKLPNGPTTSDIRNNAGAIEAGDVFGLANGHTRSKHYSDHRLMDFTSVGATGNGVGVYMVRSNHEGGSGGPFYRTIDNQCGDNQELYEIINYGEGQTEAFRMGVFNGPYILTFTGGAAPTLPIDTTWIHSTGIDATLKGWVQNRGTVTGQATGIPTGFQGVVTFANAQAQYWCVVNNGSFSSPAMIPGTYTMTLYKGELSVATTSVTVTASATPVVQNIASTEVVPFARWRIGEWDGTPAGFLNADKVTAMHPSDIRMSPWGPVTYTVGSSAASDFPAYQWKAINNPTTVKFNLTQSEIAGHTLRVGLTCSFSGARPQISVNSWTSSIPSPSSQPDSRTLTVGTYRGNNVTYTYNIPASAFVVGENTLRLTVVSGSGSTGFLSAGYSYDCVELDGPLSGAFRLTPQHAQDKSLAILNSNPANGAQTVISSYQSSAGQQFLLDVQSDGSYRVRTALPGKRCVELPFGDATNGNLVKLWDDNGNSAQRWNIVPVIGEWVKIVPKNDATKAMDVTASATADGTTVESWTYGGGSNQLWKLTPVNATPAVQGESYSISEDGTLSVAVASGVLVNDSDADGGTLTVADSDTVAVGVQPVSGPTHGTLSLNADGSFSYAPIANFNGSDSFSYRVTDGKVTSDIATVTISVTAVNDVPVAGEQSQNTTTNTALPITLAGTDIEGDSLTYSIVTDPVHGTLSGTAPNVVYTPTSGYFGSDSFTFKANDGSDDSVAATVAISVIEVNSAPTATITLAPTSPTTNSVLQATATGSDADGNEVSLPLIWKKNGAIFANEGSSLDLGKEGIGDKGDTISVSVTPNDGKVDGETVNASVTVGNSAPVLTAKSFSGRENQVLSGQVVGSDGDTEALSYSVASTTRYGTLAMQSSGAFTYTPRTNWNGVDKFTASVVDGSGASVNALCTLNVAPVNGVPVANADVVRGFEDVPLSIAVSTLLRNDLNGENRGETDALQIVKVGVASGFPGTLKSDVAKGTIVFTPRLNWNGTTSFSYTVQDSKGATATAQVTVQIVPINDAPVALAGKMAVISGTLGEVELRGTDIEGDTLTFALSGRPANGTALVIKVGDKWMLRYQSKKGFSGNDTLSVIARDGKLNSVPATVTVTVRANNAPILLSLLPNKGSFPSGSTVIFEQKVRDSDGTSHLDAAALVVSPSPTVTSANRGAALWFDAITNRFTLSTDDGKGTLPAVALGGTLQNSQVKVTLGAGDVRRETNGILTLRWRITFKPGFVGVKSLWGRVEDMGDLSAGFSKNGDFSLTNAFTKEEPIATSSSAPSS